ncbi:3-hydroxyacyl-ACP dehydratase FabZ family protein [Nocardia sp. NPDC059239]|uniref:3-hydroxyacyl-ACP dehydratase FabZ family protein n=1 Tax=unclassified Nocardia TaxID=2637762 RepID=UPI0036A89BA7
MTAITAPAPALADLDRIVELEPGRTAAAVRNVPSTLPLFDSHFPRFPVLPGVLILGSLGVLAGLLVSETVGGSWQLTAARTVRYRHFVRPGDRMQLHVDLLEPGVCSGRVLVDGKRVTTVARLELSAIGTGGAL